MTRWPRRAGLTTERLIAFALALLCALAGWLLMALQGQVALWLFLTLVAIWVGLKGGPWLVRRMERLGLFGRVRLDGGHLRAGRGLPELDLERPFRVATRLHRKDLSYEFDLRFVRGGTRQLRTERRAVTLLQARLDQEQAHLELVADDVSMPPAPSYDVEGLSCRSAPVQRPSGRVVRMRASDLLALLRALRDGAGYTATTPEDTRERVRDPRGLFWPPWERWAGGALLFALALGVGVWAMEARPAAGLEDYVPPTPKEYARLAREAAQHAGERWVGKSVGFLHTKPHYVYGVVRAFEARPPAQGEQADWTLSLRVEVRRILDDMMDPSPPGTRVELKGIGREVEVGSTVEVSPQQVYESDGP